MHSTNYSDTFIAIAPDSSTTRGTSPKESAKPTVAYLSFRFIFDHPYRYTSDDVLFEVHAARHGIPPAERDAARRAFFAKPQACLRASPLAKQYGWGVHSDAEGRVALYGVESAEYAEFVSGRKLGRNGEPVVVRYAMRSRRSA